jgi:putative ABC transport system permease protein
MKEVLDLKMNEGRWLSPGDRINKYPAIVINKTLKEMLFGNESAIGKIVGEEEKNKMQIIGVVENFKYESNYNKVKPCLIGLEEEWSKVCLVKVKPDADIVFEAKLNKELTGLGTGWSMEVQHMDNMKANKNKLVLIPLLILFIVCSFLIFNVALGLFGVLFQTINRRKGEIGLRRALGATRSNILWQFVDETIVIAVFALLLGLFFTIQFPLLHVFDVENSTYLLAILLSVISILLLVISCALLPSRQAASILPAIALHEE